jgi:hypothetical protein
MSDPGLLADAYLGDLREALHDTLADMAAEMPLLTANATARLPRYDDVATAREGLFAGVALWWTGVGRELAGSTMVALHHIGTIRAPKDRKLRWIEDVLRSALDETLAAPQLRGVDRVAAPAQHVDPDLGRVGIHTGHRTAPAGPFREAGCDLRLCRSRQSGTGEHDRRHDCADSPHRCHVSSPFNRARARSSTLTRSLRGDIRRIQNSMCETRKFAQVTERRTQTRQESPQPTAGGLPCPSPAPRR